MKKNSVKILSVILAVSVALPIAACNKKGSKGREKSRSGQKITADSPWFDSDILTIPSPKLDTPKGKTVEYTYQMLAGIDENYIAVFTNGNYRMPSGNNIDWDKIDYRDYMINVVTVVDRKTNKTINTIDLTSDIPKNSNIDKVTLTDGKIMSHTSVFDETKYQMKYVDTYYDPATGKVTDTKEIIPDDEYRSYERTFTYGKYTIGTVINWEEGDQYTYTVYVTKDDGETQTFELKADKTSLYDIPVILQLGEEKFLAAASSDSGKRFFEIDLQKGKASEADSKNYDWLDIDQIGTTVPGAEGVVYASTNTGITKIDVNKKTMQEVFNDSWCSVSRSLLGYCQLVECTEGSFVICGEKYFNNLNKEAKQEFFVITLTRAASNPHAGKTILELYAPSGYIEECIADVISEYNEKSSTHFIELHDRYSNVDDGIDYSNINSDDDYQKASIKTNAVMSNELAMDILNGEGPDILLNCSSFGQLNNSNYLVDLNKYIGELDPDKYFTTVVDSSEVDGKLFQLPICYSISGILTDAKYAGKSGVGFTTAEYEKFLKETLNGQDVINLGQAIYFTKLFSAMSDKFVVNGKVDFTSPEFAELAEFVKNNVPENAKSWNDIYNNDDEVVYATAVGVTTFKGDTYSKESVAAYASFYGVGGYFVQMAQLNGASALLGIPSTDGRGPMLEPAFSVAVSAQSKNTDACGEFVKMLMSDEVQLAIAKNDEFVLNRKAFRDSSKDIIEYFNGEGGDPYLAYDMNTGEPKNNRLKFSDKNVDELEKIILSVSSMNSTDASINTILVEEMPAYFSGQKDLNSVITIAQDRAQKVLAERG